MNVDFCVTCPSPFDFRSILGEFCSCGLAIQPEVPKTTLLLVVENFSILKNLAT